MIEFLVKFVFSDSFAQQLCANRRPKFGGHGSHHRVDCADGESAFRSDHAIRRTINVMASKALPGLGLITQRERCANDICAVREDVRRTCVVECAFGSVARIGGYREIVLWRIRNRSPSSMLLSLHSVLLSCAEVESIDEPLAQAQAARAPVFEEIFSTESSCEKSVDEFVCIHDVSERRTACVDRDIAP